MAGEKKLTFGLLLLSFALPLLAHAEPYVYWNNYNGATINRILGSGGSATTILSSLNTPFAVELDPVNNHLYYANGANLGIRRSNLDGSSPTDIVTGLGNIGVYGLALDTTNNYIYYANSNGGTLNRIAFNGVGGVQTLISGLGFPMSVALDVSGGKVYYTEFTGNKVSRANLDGSSPEVLLSATGYVGITLNVAAGKLYVATSSTVVQANLDGSSSTAILSSLSSPYGLGLDLVAQKLYVANNGGGGSIARSDLNGSNYEVIQTSAGNVFDLAVNGLIMEATPTPTPTHTSTATATATNTSTATATRTSTATRTPTATSTVTSTPTATLTATPTATSMATPTATVTPTITSSPVPTSTPTNTPTATPTVVAGMISGRLVDEFGNGVPNVVVYLSEILQNSAAKASDNTERRAGSTITDADGRYSFENLSTGNYRVEPDLQGFVFDPPEISVTEGANAPPIAAIPVQTNEETCDQTSVAAYIVKADRKVKELIDLANEEIAQLIQKSSHELQKSLTSAGSRLESGFDRILKLSTSLPKIVFECGGKEGCRSKKLKFIVKRYRLQMNEIRRIALFIARTAEIDSGTLDLARFRNSVRRNHARALQASKQLPRQTDVCESDPQS